MEDGEAVFATLDPQSSILASDSIRAIRVIRG
jgi:hypothetical protein